MSVQRRQSDGYYHIKGKRYKELFGSRAQVYHGTAYKTSGLLKASDLMKTRRDRIVSRKKHATMIKDNGRNFGANYRLARKGEDFGVHERGDSTLSRKRRKSSKKRPSRRR